VAEVLLPIRVISKRRFIFFSLAFSQLLQEASIADISYLFEEGALVDFEISELVNLVRALFADTPLRANTIDKIMQGHPVQTAS
jgi:protein transport protein DSL1/ZW10